MVKVILTDESLEFYAEEYLNEKCVGCSKDTSFEDYLDIKLQEVNYRIELLNKEGILIW